MKRLIYSLMSIALLASCSAPSPYGVVPTPQQVDWQRMEINMFCHFGPNTFSGAEWGSGEEAADLFCPTALDTRQWVAVASQAGMGGIILTAKHHDGFCLWPTELTEHSVAHSRWKEGRGDVLGELRQAIEEQPTGDRPRVKMGVYISPWDRNHPAYGTEEYNNIFARTLDEVHSLYGPMFEQWFDGACGEGPNGKKQQYDWDLFNGTVLTDEPLCVIFSDLGPGCRWVGNEEGHADTTCWSTLDTAGFSPSTAKPALEVLGRGNQGGQAWVPAEVDVSIRPGWFWHADEHPKSAEQLMEIYLQSVGRNGLLLLNVPPDTAGRIAAEDSTVLMQFRDMRERLFAHDLAREARATGSHRMGRRFGANHVLEEDYHTYWAARDSLCTLTLEWDDEICFDMVMLQEYIPLGQRITKVEMQVWDEQGTHTIAYIPLCTTVGYKRIVHLPKSISTRRVSFSFEGMAAPVINRVALYQTAL